MNIQKNIRLAMANPNVPNSVKELIRFLDTDRKKKDKVIKKCKTSIEQYEQVVQKCKTTIEKYEKVVEKCKTTIEKYEKEHQLKSVDKLRVNEPFYILKQCGIDEYKKEIYTNQWKNSFYYEINTLKANNSGNPPLSLAVIPSASSIRINFPFLNKDRCCSEGFKTSSNFERFLKSEAFNSKSSKSCSFASANARDVLPVPTGPLRINAFFFGNILRNV